MKHAFLAIRDINRRSGDVLITANKGETVTLSDRAAEVAAAFADELEYKGIIAETETEEEFETQIAEADETYDDLIRLRRPVLVEKAGRLGIPPGGLTIKQLAEAIVERRAALRTGDINLPDETEDAGTGGEEPGEENYNNEENK